ncbi:glycosyltransferase family 4 protein [Kocuria sp. cx-116]|uniref:glycosyltransferase family 4 protein n=1 Tax=Kocuria sp. cx-116 TaxID=2771378 RepID=UPI001685A6B3|nr:glycosyltransferase family 4 protein [Kocuria sp. cx-116]MBD2761955.1 glycosyltransferase family 4 protein [Kocuria sp. cx-116]
MSRVIVLGPGPDTAGGIGVMMGHLARTASDHSSLSFVESGGAPGSSAQRLRAFGRAMVTCWAPVADGTVYHVNLASNGSTWRKLVLTSLLRVRRRPYVLHLHGGGYVDFLKNLNGVMAAIVRSMFRSASSVVVLGEFWRQFVSAELGVAARKLHVIPNAVPGPASVPNAKATPTVLFTGKVTRAKGVIDLLHAWGSLPEHVRTHLVLAGDLHDPDGHITRLLEATPDVTTTGWLNGDQLKKELARASILVLPSHMENLPLSLLDGMAWGLAPVVTDVGSVSDVIEGGDSGWIVPVEAPRELANAMEVLLGDTGRREAIAQAARSRWEKQYDIAHYRRRLEDVYRQVRTG